MLKFTISQYSGMVASNSFSENLETVDFLVGPLRFPGIKVTSVIN